MRILTGDECGLIKEFVPSLINKNKKQKKRKNDNDIDDDDGSIEQHSLPPPNNKFNKDTVPVLVDNEKQEFVNRLQGIDCMNRRHGIIDMIWIQPNIEFATLAINGTVQIWTKQQQQQNTTTTNTSKQQQQPQKQQYVKTLQIDNIFEENDQTVKEGDETNVIAKGKQKKDDDDDDDDDKHKIHLKRRHNESSSKGSIDTRKKLKHNDDSDDDDDDNESGSDKDDDDDGSKSNDDDDGDEDESVTSTSSSTSSSTVSHKVQPPLNPLTFGLKIAYWMEQNKLIACNAQGMVVTIDLSQTNNNTNNSNTTPRRVQTLLYIFGKDTINVYGHEHQQGQKYTTQVVSAFAYNPTTQYIAAGGRDRETVVYDLNNLYTTTTTTKSKSISKSKLKSKQQQQDNTNDTNKKDDNDTTTKEPVPIWKAKNLPPNPQTLLSPLVWPTAITFLQPYHKKQQQQQDTSTTTTTTTVLMAVGTAHKQVRIYEILHGSNQRRPIQFTPEGVPCDYRITCIVQNQYKLDQLIIADAGGYIYSIDNIYNTLLRGKVTALRMQTTSIASHGRTTIPTTTVISSRRFVGPAGSVRQIIHHPNKSIMACVGLDRMLRIYNTKQHKQLHCIYLKQRLNCLLLDTTTTSSDDTTTTTNDNNNDLTKIKKTGTENDNDNDTDDDTDNEYNDDIVEDYTDSTDDNDGDNDDEDGVSSDDE